jgi:hypothetical protein
METVICCFQYQFEQEDEPMKETKAIFFLFHRLDDWEPHEARVSRVVLRGGLEGKFLRSTYYTDLLHNLLKSYLI